MASFEVLTSEAKALWPLLSTCSEGYYLAGGTALALQLHHRRSIDFDFFTPEHVLRTQLEKVERAFEGHKITSLVNSRDELTLFIDGVKVSFISYPFPVLMDLVKQDGIEMLAPQELAATKAYTIGRRGKWKDYVDLYTCLAQGVTTLSDVITNAQKKYETAFNDRLLLEQLVYMNDLNDVEGLEMAKPLTPNEARSYFEKAIAGLHVAG